MLVVVGLTGGIASGKSFVASYLKTKKIPVHESDQVIKDIYKKPNKAFLYILKKAGLNGAIEKNKINKKKIRVEIFKNKRKKQALEIYLHSEVRKSRKIFLKKNQNKKIVFLDIPLLFEKRLEKVCNYVCSAIAPLKIRKARAMNRCGMSKEIFAKIIEAQIKDFDRKKKSNFIINTSKSRSKTCLQVDKIIYDILNI